MDSLTREEVRAVDRAAIEVLGIPGLILMENAGRNCADAIEELLDTDVRPEVAVVAGPGNNGGDGYVIARHLAMRGFSVRTLVICPREKITGDAAVNLQAIIALRHNVQFLTAEELGDLSRMLASCDLVVDAIVGTGIQGALRGGAAVAVEQINAAGLKVAAIDIPTGLDCDTGQAEGPVIRADLTITLVAPKKGFALGHASRYTGSVVVADIGIPADLVASISSESDK